MSSIEEESSADELMGTPPELKDLADKATLKLLPEKLQKQYEIAYKRFSGWSADKGTKLITENVMLAYFSDRAKEIKPSSLWSEYSMIRSSLIVKENKDIKKYKKLISFMKRNSSGFRPKKSKILKRDQFYKCLKEAPDSQHLFNKVVAIFGIAGALRRDELQKLTTDDIQDKESFLYVNVPQSKTDKQRHFVIKGEVEDELNLISIYKKYADLRPQHTPTRLFLNYLNGKCTVQPVGVNKFAKVPSIISQFLNLGSCELYTGHCFRRSSATLLADTGAEIRSLKRHGGWKSSTVAENYVDESIQNKIDVAEQMFPCQIDNEV